MLTGHPTFICQNLVDWWDKWYKVTWSAVGNVNHDDFDFRLKAQQHNNMFLVFVIIFHPFTPAQNIIKINLHIIATCKLWEFFRSVFSELFAGEVVQKTTLHCLLLLLICIHHLEKWNSNTNKKQLTRVVCFGPDYPFLSCHHSM